MRVQNEHERGITEKHFSVTRVQKVAVQVDAKFAISQRIEMELGRIIVLLQFQRNSVRTDLLIELIMMIKSLNVDLDLNERVIGTNVNRKRRDHIRIAQN